MKKLALGPPTKNIEDRTFFYQFPLGKGSLTELRLRGQASDLLPNIRTPGYKEDPEDVATRINKTSIIRKKN